MKKITLLVATNLLVGSLALATEKATFSDFERNVTSANHYMEAEPIIFMERGIEFYVFLNGDFDFNTRPQDSQGGIFYRRGGTRGNTTVAVNYGVRIEHDSFGRVRRVGNTFINYDSRNRVSRIGSVFMRYNRFALTQIGGMQMVYNSRGMLIRTIGQVNFTRGNYGYAHTSYYGNNSYYTSGYTYNDNSNYYYKTDGAQTVVEEKNK
ncbi:hypothetical protein [Flavobacterium sp.]|uniref:hypothetical protein n=1 Tax=Flavobacterium sp. TaxID=239 RepID=UPI0035299A68